MSEERAEYNVDLTGFEIAGERERIVREGGKSVVVKDSPWIKFDVGFRKASLRQLRGTPLSVFICIALHMNKDGEAWPSYETIMEETGIENRNTLRKSLNFLYKQELIDVIRGVGRGHSNRYKIKAYASFGPPEKGTKSVPFGGEKGSESVPFTGEKGSIVEQEKGSITATGSRLIEVDSEEDDKGNSPLPIDQDLAKTITAYTNINATIGPYQVQRLEDYLLMWRNHRDSIPNSHPDKSKSPGDVLVMALDVTMSNLSQFKFSYFEKVILGWMENGVGNKPKPRVYNGRQSKSDPRTQLAPGEYAKILAEKRERARAAMKGPTLGEAHPELFKDDDKWTPSG